ncbi:hypothetical protein ACA910_013182 [Epithemia clementina (nom. ined.)]
MTTTATTMLANDHRKQVGGGDHVSSSWSNNSEWLFHVHLQHQQQQRRRSRLWPQEQEQEQEQKHQQRELLGPYAHYTFKEVEEAGPALAPGMFDPPVIQAAVTSNEPLEAWDPETSTIQYCDHVIRLHNEEEQLTNRINDVAYWPRRQLQKAIYGTVCLGYVLRKVRKTVQKSQDSHNIAPPPGFAPKTTSTTIVVQVEEKWEITTQLVAIKTLRLDMIQQWHGKYAENPMQEIAALQYLQTNLERKQQGLKQRNGSATALTTSNVMTYTDVWQDDTYLYCIMPYCKYGDLFGIVLHYNKTVAQRRRECNEDREDDGGDSLESDTSNNNDYDKDSGATYAGGMPEPVARHCFRQILQGLHTLQRHGICHRDLSLENVLMDSHKQCQIIDFGMCLRIPYHQGGDEEEDDNTNGQGSGRHQDSKTSLRRLMKPQAICGKSKYMSPEVKASQDDMDGFAVDLWSTGVILYTLLTGFHPYDQACSTDLRYERIAQGGLVEALHEWGIYLSPYAEDLLHQMLQPDPRRRLTLAQVMEHPWVVHRLVEEPDLSSYFQNKDNKNNSHDSDHDADNSGCDDDDSIDPLL